MLVVVLNNTVMWLYRVTALEVSSSCTISSVFFMLPVMVKQS